MELPLPKTELLEEALLVVELVFVRSGVISRFLGGTAVVGLL